MLLQNYNPKWAEDFDHLKDFLQSELSRFDVSIQHVGSTSVEGMVAKPILDIDIILHTTTQLPAVSRCLEELGYLSKGEQGIEGRFAFRQSSERTPNSYEPINWREHHLYVCYPTSLALKNHLVFRDALRRNPDLVGAYSQLKLKLAADKSIRRDTYTQNKTDFILQVLGQNGLKAEELESINQANR